MNNNELTHPILQEIDALSKKGVLPVSVNHLEHLCRQGDVLGRLIAMKSEGLISGDLITIGINGTPHRLTNIRLTYMGIRALAQPVSDNVINIKERTHRPGTGKSD